MQGIVRERKLGSQNPRGDWTGLTFRTSQGAAVVGSGGCVVERQTVNRGDGGSIPPTAVSKVR